MADEAKKTDLRTVQLKRVRLSFSDSLKDARPTSTEPGAVPKHASNVIIEFVGDDAKAKAKAQENKDKCIAAIKEAGDQEWKKPDAYISIAEDNPKRLCFRKGERFKNGDGNVYLGYEGNWAISGTGPGGNKNPRRPKLFDRYKRPVEEKDINEVFYPGSYCDAVLAFYGTDKGGSRGIFCSIEAIRSHQEGPRMGGGSFVDADDFDDMEDADDAFAGTSAAVENDPLG